MLVRDTEMFDLQDRIANGTNIITISSITISDGLREWYRANLYNDLLSRSKETISNLNIEALLQLFWKENTTKLVNSQITHS